MGLAFSATYPLKITGPSIKVRVEDDIASKSGSLFSDGIGKMDLKTTNFVRRRCKDQNISVVQIRYGGAKGLLVYNPEIQSDYPELVFRKSMVKYQNDNKDLKLELIDFNKYRGGYLNRQVIILLLTNGVDPKNIYNMYKKYVTTIESQVNLNGGIYKYFNQDFDGSLAKMRPIDEIIREMINSKISIEGDPFISGVIETFRTKGYQQLKDKCNILVDQSARLMGNK